MAWNPGPEVAAARDYGKKFGCKRVIILVESHDGAVGYVSYGANVALCNGSKRIADDVFQPFMDAVVKETKRK